MFNKFPDDQKFLLNITKVLGSKREKGSENLIFDMEEIFFSFPKVSTRQNLIQLHLYLTYEAKYSRMDQVKFLQAVFHKFCLIRS